MEADRPSATASSGEHAVVERRRGVPIDYRREDFVAYGASSAVGKGRAGFLPTLARVTACRLVPRGRSASFHGIGGRLGREDPTVREDLARVLALAARGALAPEIGARVPFAQARRAHELEESGGPAGEVLLVAGA